MSQISSNSAHHMIVSLSNFYFSGILHHCMYIFYLFIYFLTLTATYSCFAHQTSPIRINVIETIQMYMWHTVSQQVVAVF